MSKHKVIAIAAMDQNRVIGKDNQIPWHIPEDMKNFSKLTTGHAVIMGSKTYDSLPDKFRPLPKRLNIVVTQNPEKYNHEEEIEVTSDPITLIKQYQNGECLTEHEELWVIGGSEIYKLTMPYWDEAYITHIKGEYEGDTFFPEFETQFKEDVVESNDQFQVYKYTKV